MHRIIPEYDDYELIGRVRTDANLAIANGEPVLLARGLINGAGVVHKFGAAAGVGTALKPISTSQTYQTPQVAAVLEMVSGDTNDNGTTSPLGTGALVVRVYGIAAWADGEVTEDVTLNGTTPVALATSFLRVYRMKVIKSGTYATADTPSHDSVILLRGTGGGVAWATITSLGGIGLGQSEIASYSIPDGKIGYMQSAFLTVESSKGANIIFIVRECADEPDCVTQAKIVLRVVTDTVDIHPRTPYGGFVGPCDLGWMGEAVLGSASISADFELIIYDA